MIKSQMGIFNRKQQWRDEIRAEIMEEVRAVTFQDFWGTDTTPDIRRTTTVQRALTLSPVYSATGLISDAIASLPLVGYRKLGGDRAREIDPPALFNDPTLFGGPYEWIQRVLTSLLLRGNAYGYVTVFDSEGFPRQIEWLDPDHVSPRDGDHTLARPVWMWNGVEVFPWTGRDSTGRMVHIPWYVLAGKLLGVSPVGVFAAIIEGGLSTHEFGQGFFANDGMPKAVLETENPIDGEQAKAIKTRWKEASRGRDIVVAGAGLKYKQMTLSPNEAQFLETIRATATEIAAIYRIYPAELIGGDTKDSMTYANTEQQSLNMVTHTLRPYLTKLEQALSSLLPRPQFVKFKLDELLRADQKTRYESHGIAIDKGFKTRDEVRDEEGLPPLTAAQKQEFDQQQPQAGGGGTGSNVIPLPRAAGE